MQQSDKITWLCAIIFPFLLLLLIGNALVFDQQAYQSMLRQGALPTTMQVLDYFEGRAVLPDIFNEREKSHLADVKDVIHLLRYASLILLVVFLALLPKADLGGVFMRGFWILLLLVLILGFVPFDNIFGNFHKIFFSEETWIFPEGSMLILLYPEQFFQAFFTYITSLTLAYSAVFFLFGYMLQKQKA
jgi:integral membrane protein (TIGR01906 family)